VVYFKPRFRMSHAALGSSDYKTAGDIMPKTGDHIFIVGGTSGLGYSIAQAADALGAKVTIAGRGRERAAELARSISPRASGLHIDLEDSSSIDEAFAKDEAIDHLVLTPVYGVNQSIKDFNVAEASRAARIKIVAFAEVVSKALPRLKPTSSIVLFGGLAKANPYPGSTMVSIVNGGMVGMARTLAVELAPIRVNGISPGLVEDSPRWQRRIKEGAGPTVEAMRSRTPSRRLATTEDIVHGAFFLMDNRAANGIDLELDGGIQSV
jgi:NAD(P)-dependent dehydrogenase (short-subunit alcohol dehydrogenase family)